MLALNRRIQRKVYDENGRLLSTAIAREGLWIREYRKRTAFLLPWGVALYRAQVLAADATKVVAPRRKKKAAKAKKH